MRQAYIGYLYYEPEIACPHLTDPIKKWWKLLKGNLRKQDSCIDTASQLISLALQVACFNS